MSVNAHLAAGMLLDLQQLGAMSLRGKMTERDTKPSLPNKGHGSDGSTYPIWGPDSRARGDLDAWEMLIGSSQDFDLRSVHSSFSVPKSPNSDLIPKTLCISRMIPTPNVYPYMGLLIHQPYRIAYGEDTKPCEPRKTDKK